MAFARPIRANFQDLRSKTSDLRNLGNFKKIPEMYGFDDGKYSAGHPKAKF